MRQRGRAALRRRLLPALLCMLLVFVTGCGGETADDGADTAVVDVDLTQLSSTMVYAEISNIMVNPDDYPTEGDEIVVQGTFDTYYEGEYMYPTLRKASLIEQ